MPVNDTNNTITFSREVPGLGTFELRPFSLEEDIIFLHDWVNRPYAQYWGLLGNTIAEVTEAYQALIDTPDYEVYTAFWQGKPVFITECYAVETDLIAQYYEVQPGDRGMHVLVAPPDQKIKGFTWAVFTTIMEFMFSDVSVKRIVVEPDLRNDKIHALNKRAGFVYNKVIDLPHKVAHLAFCTKAQYKAAMRMQNQTGANPDVSYLEPLGWEKVNCLLVRKALSEFTHELLLQPQPLENEGYYKVWADDPIIEYRFKAVKFALDHWHIEADSIKKYQQDKEMPVDALLFITEFEEQLGIPEQFQATYLEEISGTLLSSAYKWQHEQLTAEDLTKADFQEVEHAMSEGHPCFVANNGRTGFSAEEFGQYAPEANTPFRLVWLAGHVSCARYTGISGLSHEQLLEQELGETLVTKFNQKLENLGLNPEDYVLMPAHPWQWNNKLVNLFAADIANQKLVYLGRGGDLYSAQQSVRTLYNLSHPEKFYTKTAMGITNMGFMRGLSPYYMQSTPPVTEWIRGLLGNDGYLKACGFEMLDEVATVGYRNTYFEKLGRSYPQNKMLAALWRQSPMQKVQSHESVMTMAAFLHIDKSGQALLPLLIQASGVSIQTWLKAYLKCYLSPLLHCFYAHELVFMPHGENLIMVLDNHVPVRALMKDITEEVLLYNDALDLPEQVQRLYTETSDEMQLLSLFTDVFDCFFRFMGVILHTQAGYHEDRFWEQVAACITDYQTAHPEFEKKYARYDLFVPEFKRCCLNRLQLSNHKQMLDLTDPVNSLKIVSVLKNPVAQFKPVALLANEH